VGAQTYSAPAPAVFWGSGTFSGFGPKQVFAFGL
jgi:hypothetical protein